MKGSRTDLAKEWASSSHLPQGTSHSFQTIDGLTAEIFSIQTAEAADNLKKPVGDYYTIEISFLKGLLEDFEQAATALSGFIKKLLPAGAILVAGLGNAAITADALGPRSVEGIFTTRHLRETLAAIQGFEHLREVSALAPGVLGQTGIETAEIIAAAVQAVSPAAVIAIDALAAKDAFHIGRTLQFSSAGIFPGSGVANHRRGLTVDTLGVPVIAVGTPTVSVLSRSEGELVVTPREIDTVIAAASRLISASLNLALQPSLSLRELDLLMA